MSHLTPKLDASIRPQDDFFGHVNGLWLKENPIPESETYWGTFSVLRENAWKAMRDIYEELQKSSPKPGSIKQQARDYYFTGMNFDTLKDEHLRLFRQLLAEIDTIKNTSELSGAIGRLHAMGITSPWFCYVDSDHDDTTKHVLHFRQSGLTLPNRDYYLDKSEKMRSIRTQYKTFSEAVYAKLPELAQSSSHLWKTLIDFETNIATISRTSAALRDVENNYHKTPLAKVKKTYYAIDWDAYGMAFGWKPDDKITIDQPEFMEFIHSAFDSQPLDAWKIYLKWNLTTKFLPKISTDFAKLHFSFFGKVLSGTTEMMPLWKRVVLATEHAIGEATGKLYAERHFPEDSKKQVLSLVEEVRDAYSERIDQLDWMSAKTKAYAKDKLANMKVLIGYPDHWRDFSTLAIGRDSYLGNTIAANQFEMAYWLKKLHEPTSRDEWFMTPQTVNAYNDPTRLVICFPAAILQAPFFSPQASLASNMGGIGTVIGHEFTHGFDDEGSMFDAKGNVRTWQTKAERAAFAKRAKRIVDQADAFEVLPGLTLRGGLVLGESIADLGGVELALHAFKKHQPSNDNLREFFVAYAFTECGKIRDEKLREYTLSDPHPASEFRVNGTLQHVDDFHRVHNTKEGMPLYRSPEERARIW